MASITMGSWRSVTGRAYGPPSSLTEGCRVAGNLAAMSKGDTTVARSGAFVAFRYRNFTLMWSASLLSASGTWLQNVAVPFVIYRITESGAWLGFTAFMSYLPMVLTGPWAGSVADRFPRRRVLLVTGLVQFAFTTLLWLVWIAGERRIGVIIALLVANTFAAGLGVASWQAFVTELVPREHLLNAVTLNSAQFNAARAFGPALGGIVLATMGPGWSFFFNALTFLFMIAALLLVKVTERVRERADGPPRAVAEMWQAVRYVGTERGIVACLLVVFALGFLGGPLFNLLVVFADEVYDVGDGAYGLLAGCMGLGAILVAPLIAGPGSRVRRSRLLVLAVGGYGLALIAVGLAPVALLGALALLAAGAGYLGISSTLNTTVQLQVTEGMRGKVLALYVMTLTLAMPIGSLLQGWLVDIVGVQATVAGAGVIMLCLLAWIRFGSGGLLRAMDSQAEPTRPDAALLVAEAEATEAAVDPYSRRPPRTRPVGRPSLPALLGQRRGVQSSSRRSSSRSSSPRWARPGPHPARAGHQRQARPGRTTGSRVPTSSWWRMRAPSTVRATAACSSPSVTASGCARPESR
jgi:MFS family permease